LNIERCQSLPALLATLKLDLAFKGKLLGASRNPDITVTLKYLSYGRWNLFDAEYCSFPDIDHTILANGS